MAKAGEKPSTLRRTLITIAMSLVALVALAKNAPDDAAMLSISEDIFGKLMIAMVDCPENLSLPVDRTAVCGKSAVNFQIFQMGIDTMFMIVDHERKTKSKAIGAWKQDKGAYRRSYTISGRSYALEFRDDDRLIVASWEPTETALPAADAVEPAAASDLARSSCGSACLSSEQIETLIRLGKSAKQVKNAPSFLSAGTEYPKGSFARSMMLNTSESPYLFLIRSCKQWVTNAAFVANINHQDVALEAIHEQCLDQNIVRVAVVSNAYANEMVSQAFGSYPLPSLPVTAIALELDGTVLRPLSDENFAMFGPGTGTALFDVEAVLKAKKIVILATVDSRYQLRQDVSSKLRRSLF